MDEFDQKQLNNVMLGMLKQFQYFENQGESIKTQFESQELQNNLNLDKTKTVIDEILPYVTVEGLKEADESGFEEVKDLFERLSGKKETPQGVQ